MYSTVLLSKLDHGSSSSSGYITKRIRKVIDIQHGDESSKMLSFVEF